VDRLQSGGQAGPGLGRGKTQIPPDLVVETQAIDIVEVIL
jgi:hypothetical protein